MPGMVETGIKRLDAIEPRRGAAVLLEVLRSEGCRYIFGNPGTTELALMDALTGAPDIRYIWGLQEATAVAMADGYANASGRPGFVNLHTAGGLGHGMGRSSVPGCPTRHSSSRLGSRTRAMALLTRSYRAIL